MHGVLLTDLYARQVSGVRGDPMSSWVGFVVASSVSSLLPTRTQRATKGESSVHDGTRFGVLVALMLITLAAVWGYVVFPISSGPAAALAIDYVVDCDFRNDCW